MHDNYFKVWNRGGNTPIVICGPEEISMKPLTEVTTKVAEVGECEREVVWWKDMQEKTGTLSPGAHAGSYNGQDAYNDLLVVDDECGKRGQRTVASDGHDGNSECAGLYARCTGNSGRGGMR